MSTIDPASTGTILQNFRLIERASGSAWRAEDTRNGKSVAVKFLSKGLPKDAARREALIRDVRQNAALYHSFLVAIQEVVAAGDSLLLVMEWLDAQPISKHVKGKPLDRTEFFRIAYQIADALKLLHAKNIVHGNIAGDSILILPTGQAKLAGLNLGNILPRQGQPSQFQQKGNDLRAVSYMAPEQITNQAVGPTTDIFSLGLVLYEAATGRMPYQAATAADVAHKIVEEHPPSPKSVNPNIDNAVLSVLGGCLFKDPFKRHKDGKAVLDAINRVDPEAGKFAAETAKAAAAPAAAPAAAARKKNGILFVADVANYDELMKSDPQAAVKSTARMQQILGEAVYLFDGKVLDPFGPHMIAELGTLEQAIEAGRKGEFDFSADQQTGEIIPVRMLLHAGEVEEREGGIDGAGVEKAIEVLQHLQPQTLYVTEDFARRGKAPVRFRDAGARAGVKLATIVPPEPKVEEVVDTAAEEDAAAAEAEEEAARVEAAAVAAGKQKRRRAMIAAAVAVLVLLGAGAAFFLRPHRNEQQIAAAKTQSGPPPATAANPRKVSVTVAAADPALADRANAIRLAVAEILRSFPEVRLADDPGPDVSAFAAQLRTGTAGPEIVVENAAAVPAPDNSSVVQPILQRIASHLHIPMRGAATPEAYNAFADAVAARSGNDVAREDASIRAAINADPNFVAAQMFAMRFFTEQKKPVDALEAAKHVLTADPGNADAARMVARTSLSTGDLASAFIGYGAMLRTNPNDAEALNAIGKYAVAVSDIQKVSAVLRRLAASPAAAEVHEPDVLMAAGRVDQAVEKYYTVEERTPNNPALCLKIGRIAVLRHSIPIAELELKKLQESDPLYGMHILKAYLAAQSGNRVDAAKELKAALDASTAGDDYWTAAAEVAAIAGDTPGVLDALERAAMRKEPTVSYILNDPLFTFLENDPKFQQIRATLLAEQNEIRSALATVSL